jgi:hypothetical protein
MRAPALLIVLLAACGGDDECMPITGSRLSYRLGAVASGKQIAGVSWVEQLRGSAPLTHVAIVHADGTLSPDIPSTSQLGVAGTRTVLWHRDSDDECHSGEKFEFNPLLYDGTNTIALAIAPVTRARTAVFDGTRYQLFWSDGHVFHRTLDEDGTLGPVHDLGLERDCVTAATDGAGTTFIRADDEAFIVDSAGTKRLVWSATEFGSHGAAFYFAGEFHITGFDWWSIDPVTGASRKRAVSMNGLAYHQGATKMFVRLANDIVELDASLSPIAHVPLRGTMMKAGAFGDELVFLAQYPVDDIFGPKRIAVERGDRWSTELAADSQTETLDACP